MNRIIAPLACLCLGTAIGWLSRDTPDSPVRGEGSTRISPRMAQERQRSSSLVMPADVAARMAMVHAARTPEERLRAVLHLAQTLPVSEFARWYDAKWLKLSDNGELDVFYGITRQRWLEEDPTGLMQVAQLRNWSNYADLAIRWADQDPMAALTYLKSLKQSQGRDRMLLWIAPTLARHQPAEVLALIHAHRDPPNESSNWNDTLKALARHHPQLLESAELPAPLAVQAEAILAGTRLDQDFSSGLQALLDAPGGLLQFRTILRNGDHTASLSEGFLRQLERLPPEWINEFINYPAMISANPEAWLEKDFIALGLSESRARDFQQTLWQALARKNPERVLANFADQPLDQTTSFFPVYLALAKLRQTSPDAFAEQFGHFTRNTTDPSLLARLEQLRAPEPAEAKPNLAALLESGNRGLVLSEIASTMILNNPEMRRELQEKLTSMDPKQVAAIGHATQHSMEGIPLQARATIAASMAAHPNPNNGDHQPAIRAASRVATDWLQQDSTGASQWVAALPASAARTWAIRNLAVNWLPTDTPAATRWLQSLPAAEQADVQQFIETRAGAQ